ncbi:MAG: cation transporter [Clostridia bacterium]|nr:cation transporter [Clostridia bacterium]
MKLKFSITGLDCPNCAAKLSAMLEKEEGIDSAKINFLTEKVTVETALAESDALALVRATAAKFSKSVVIE